MRRCCWLITKLARKRVAIPILFMLHVLHPLLHPFEGGALDALMATMTVWASHAED